MLGVRLEVAEFINDVEMDPLARGNIAEPDEKPGAVVNLEV